MTDTATIAETLRAALGEATRGPWSRYDGLILDSDGSALGEAYLEQDEEYIAACQPDNIRALLDERDRLTASLAAEREAREIAERENNDFRTWGVIEVAIRNPNVASYIEHWEARAEAAEAEIARLTAERDAAAEKEREACAVIAEADCRTALAIEHEYKPTWYIRAQQIAAAIRARSEEATDAR